MFTNQNANNLIWNPPSFGTQAGPESRVHFVQPWSCHCSTTGLCHRWKRKCFHIPMDYRQSTGSWLYLCLFEFSFSYLEWRDEGRNCPTRPWWRLKNYGRCSNDSHTQAQQRNYSIFEQYSSIHKLNRSTLDDTNTRTIVWIIGRLINKCLAKGKQAAVGNGHEVAR